jgi:hypothetical protein
MTPNSTPEDRAGATRTFRTDHGKRVTVVIIFAAMITVLAVVAFGSAGRHAGLGVLGAVLLVGLFAVPTGWLCFRSLRVGVEVCDGMVTIRNISRVRAVVASDILAVTLRSMDRGPEVHWVPEVELANGKHIPLYGLDCGQTNTPPKPAALAVLDELRALLGLGTTPQTECTASEEAESARNDHPGRSAEPVEDSEGWGTNAD